jgi:hypothetical protein
MVGSASPALISRLSRATISGGVPLGMPTPAHDLASYPGSVSAMLGTSGSMSNRRLPATPSARKAPVRTWGIEANLHLSANQIGHHGRAAAIGNVHQLIPAIILNSSLAKYEADPVEAV